MLILCYLLNRCLLILLVVKDDTFESHLLLNSVEVGIVRIAIVRGTTMCPRLVMYTIPHDTIIATSYHRKSYCESQSSPETLNEKGEHFTPLLSVRDKACSTITVKLLVCLWIDS